MPPARRTPSCSAGSPATGTRRHSPSWSAGTAGWSGPSAGTCSATRPTPRTPSRPPSSPWSGRPGRCGTADGWAGGCTGWPSGSARRPGGRRPAARRGSGPAAGGEAGRPVPDAAWDAALAAVHEEVARLPDALRVPFVLCCLEGRGVTEAAARLGWKLGTLSGRLTRAKQAVLARLGRSGGSPPGRRRRRRLPAGRRDGGGPGPTASSGRLGLADPGAGRVGNGSSPVPGSDEYGDDEDETVGGAAVMVAAAVGDERCGRTGRCRRPTPRRQPMT